MFQVAEVADYNNVDALLGNNQEPISFDNYVDEDGVAEEPFFDLEEWLLSQTQYEL